MSQICRHLHKFHGMEWTGYVSIINHTYKAHQENHAHKAHQENHAHKENHAHQENRAPEAHHAHHDAPVEQDPFNQQQDTNFDERSLFEKLQKVSKQNDSIRSIVDWCLKKRQASYKIIRTIQKSFKVGDKDHKLKVFYILHELSLKSSENKYQDMIRRLAESILFILPDVLDSAPVEKVDRCLNIWKRWHVFGNDMIAIFDKVVKSRKQELSKTTLDNESEINLRKQEKLKKRDEPLANESVSVERPLETIRTEEKDVTEKRIPLESRLQQEFQLEI